MLVYGAEAAADDLGDLAVALAEHDPVEHLRFPWCRAEANKTFRSGNGAILLRAERFRMQSTTIQSCDVGVDVAENANHVLIERNRFVDNRVGVRFAASNPNTMVVKNEFVAHRDAGGSGGALVCILF